MHSMNKGIDIGRKSKDKDHADLFAVSIDLRLYSTDLIKVMKVCE